MRGWQNNIYFVPVEPKEPGNIGASARAMKNRGFRNLRVMNRQTFLKTEGGVL
jgi:tRNA C32,U32 (ribose-2'-O)-methylase TrmJ